MKRLMYLFLAGVLVAGFTMGGVTRAEAMDSGSAALLAGTVAVIGGAVLYAAALDADHHRPVYASSYPVTYYGEVHRPVRSRVVYVHRDRRGCFRDHYRGDHRGWRHDYRRY